MLVEGLFMFEVFWTLVTLVHSQVQMVSLDVDFEVVTRTEGLFTPLCAVIHEALFFRSLLLFFLLRVDKVKILSWSNELLNWLRVLVQSLLVDLLRVKANQLCSLILWLLIVIIKFKQSTFCSFLFCLMSLLMKHKSFLFNELSVTEFALERGFIIMHFNQMLLQLILFLEFVTSENWLTLHLLTLYGLSAFWTGTGLRIMDWLYMSSEMVIINKSIRKAVQVGTNELSLILLIMCIIHMSV